MSPFLADKRVESPQLCTDLLIAHVLGCERLQLYLDADREATAEELAMLRELVQRAGRHEPVQYLVGRWAFHGCELEVGPATLIPRPCTELLVEEAIRVLSDGGDEGATPLCIVDLCTGTGCIAIAVARALRAQRTGRRQLAWKGDGSSEPIASEAGARRGFRIIATDVVPSAVELARRNVAAHRLESFVEVIQGDLERALAPCGIDGTVDVLCANPPYISDVEWRDVPENVRGWEPESALRGGVDGLDMVRRVAGCAPRLLRGGGVLLCEIAASQEQAALEIAASAGLIEATVLRDLERLPRLLRARCAR
jgi:release factor glutamine methyltransferase